MAAHVIPPVFHVKRGIAYQQNNRFNLRAIDMKIEDILWEQNFDEPILIPPIFVEEKAFVKTGHTGVDIVSAIDLTNGEILWKNPPGKTNWANQENVIGTIAEDNGYIFYLSVDGQLQVLNTITGQVLGRVQFAPRLQELDDFDLTNREFCAVASNNVVVVYLGSGRQLFAFRFSPDN